MATAGRPPPEPTPHASPTATPQPKRAAELSNRLKERFPDTVIDYMREKRLKITTTPDKIRDVAEFVRDGLGFDHISCVSGTDYIGKNEIEIIYFVSSLSQPEMKDFVIAVAERPKRDNPVVHSLIDIWPGAEYHERETYEMLGVNFQGHPDLKHLLLPEDWSDMPPLRKDYISPGR